jgi:hypothetical protein
MLIVDRCTKLEEFTDAFDPKSAHSIIEVKSHGTFSERALEQIKRIFENYIRNMELNPYRSFLLPHKWIFKVWHNPSPYKGIRLT